MEGKKERKEKRNVKELKMRKLIKRIYSSGRKENLCNLQAFVAEAKPGRNSDNGLYYGSMNYEALK